MGIYYNPAKEVKHIGRILRWGEYKDIVKQLKDGEFLFGVYDRGWCTQAIYLYDEKEYNRVEDCVKRDATIRRVGYFALTEEDIKIGCKMSGKAIAQYYHIKEQMKND